MNGRMKDELEREIDRLVSDIETAESDIQEGRIIGAKLEIERKQILIWQEKVVAYKYLISHNGGPYPYSPL
jgi:hypothetical protein